MTTYKKASWSKLQGDTLIELTEIDSSGPKISVHNVHTFDKRTIELDHDDLKKLIHIAVELIAHDENR